MNRISNARVNIHNLFPPDKLPNYVKQKLEEKQRIDEEIRQVIFRIGEADSYVVELQKT